MAFPATFVTGFHDEDKVLKMEYSPLGKTGLNVSKISIGGGVFSHFYGYFVLSEKNFINFV